MSRKASTAIEIIFNYASFVSLIFVSALITGIPLESKAVLFMSLIVCTMSQIVSSYLYPDQGEGFIKRLRLNSSVLLLIEGVVFLYAANAVYVVPLVLASLYLNKYLLSFVEES